jgi:nitronate monooxygenase
MNIEKILPEIIQGGMGVGVSSWKLAKEVSMHGQLGVVSGTAVAVTFARRLQEEETHDLMKEILVDFPFPNIRDRVISKYPVNIERKGDKYKSVPMPSIDQSKDLTDLMVLATYAEIKLAKSGHNGLIGVNLLEKIQVPTLPSLYGAILADVDYVLMGAGIPIRIPSILTDLALNKDVSLPIKIADDHLTEQTLAHFSPVQFAEGNVLPTLKRPKFLAIISSQTLAIHLMRSSYGAPDGFVVEHNIAGGHNAPPRGKYEYNENGEPIYGLRDEIDIAQIKAIGLPFWLAGGYGSREQLLTAKELGASGVQVGTAFAFCEESGLNKSLKLRILEALKIGKARVKTDPLASPTGFPFKVVDIEGTIGEVETGNQRKRICDLGYLREPYRKENGNVGYRCPSEPVDDYIKKGGKIEDTVGRRCLCNGLVSTMGIGQERKDGSVELPLVTAGDDLKYILRFLPSGEKLYKAIDVLKVLLGEKFKAYSKVQI